MVRLLTLGAELIFRLRFFLQSAPTEDNVAGHVLPTSCFRLYYCGVFASCRTLALWWRFLARLGENLPNASAHRSRYAIEVERKG
jgi:hypothetical protein